MLRRSEAQDRHRALLAHWQEQLGLGSYRIELERVSIFAVCDELCRVGNSLVGVVCDHEQRAATIFHTRRLTPADVVHELLHVKHPEWSEAEVNAETDRLLRSGVGNPSRAPGAPALAATRP